MDIYTDAGTEGVIDIGKAKSELKGALAITHEPTRRGVLHELNTAILLDIAASLRPLAAEALAAMPSPFTVTDPGPESEADRDFFVEGDLVIAEGMDEPGEIKGFGQSEGAIYADVLLANGVEIRAWLDQLRRLVGDEGDGSGDDERTVDDTLAAGGAVIDGESALIAEPAGEDVARELAADIDDDFAGDHHTAAENALDVLKANEAQRKAAKKKGSSK